MDYLACTLITGAGATALLDLWGVARRPLFAIAPPDYGLIGRWLGHMTRGRFWHSSIAASAPVPHERVVGWIAHYLIGIGFAAVLVGICGRPWIEHPSIGAALAVGIGGIAAPFLVMQPAMGAGVAASRTPRPAAARLQTVLTHAFFAVGLYLAGWVAHFSCAA